MFDSFRQSMTWLHTWAGLVLGSLLIVIFFMGTLSVFDREIDRWMMPSTRLSMTEDFSIDRVLPEINRITNNADRWTGILPDAREPVMKIFFRDASGEFTSRQLNPITGKALPDPGTFGAREFFYPFHYGLHIKFMNIGIWIVGFAAMTMLVLLVSGVIIHIRIFKDFFTFRPKKQLQRSSLDLHNLTGVIALPFHFIFPLSGLFIFFSIYLPSGIQVAYKNNNSFFEQAFSNYKLPKADIPAKFASIDNMLQEAKEKWGSGEAGLIRVVNAGDANAVVEVRRKASDRLVVDFETIYFNGVDGKVIKQTKLKPAMATQQFFAGLHLSMFDHWPIRWLYFLMGLASCVMMASGFILWTEKRKTKHIKDNHSGSRVVAAIAITSVTGLLIATLSMFVANRLLPTDIFERARCEVTIFFAMWIISAIHAWFSIGNKLFIKKCWKVQTLVVMLLSLAAPIFNWITTGDYPHKTFMQAEWSVLGTDCILLLTAIIAGLAFKRLQTKAVKTDSLSIPTDLSTMEGGRA